MLCTGNRNTLGEDILGIAGRGESIDPDGYHLCYSIIYFLLPGTCITGIISE